MRVAALLLQLLLVLQTNEIRAKKSSSVSEPQTPGMLLVVLFVRAAGCHT